MPPFTTGVAVRASTRRGDGCDSLASLHSYKDARGAAPAVLQTAVSVNLAAEPYPLALAFSRKRNSRTDPPKQGLSISR